jgi:hypothetical protein
MMDNNSIFMGPPTISTTVGTTGVKIDSSGISILKPKTYLVQYEFMLLNLSLSNIEFASCLFSTTDFIELSEKDSLKDELMIAHAEEIVDAKNKGISFKVHCKELNRWVMEE